MTYTDFISSFADHARAPLRLPRLIALWRSRQALAQLDDSALADIGVTRQAADREAQKPVWDVPAHWR